MNKTVGAVISALVIIFCIVIALFCTVRIPAGYVGVIYNMNGGVAETTLTQGFHLVKPTQKVTTYTIGIEQFTSPPVRTVIPKAMNPLKSRPMMAKVSRSI